MPITKTAKRALRSSKRKQDVNKAFMTRFEVAIREAKKNKTEDAIKKASSLADRAAKKHIIHKNKASRIKSRLSKLITEKTTPKKKSSKN